MGKILLGKFVLAGSRGVQPDWGVAVQGSEILAVASHEELSRAYPGFEQVDYRDKIISPGFVNSHMHSYGILSHGIIPPGEIDGFEAFLHDFWWPLVEDRLDHQMIQVAGKAAALELLDSGVTTFCDVLEAPYSIPGGLDAHAAVLEEIGLRGVLSFEASQRVSEENGLLGLQENRDFYLKYRDHPLISGMMCFHTTITCDEGFISQASSMAREIGSGIQMHLSESRYEPEWCRKRYGKSPVEFYEGLNFWHPRVLASQGVKLTEAEIDILRKHGPNLVHVPLSNCEVGGGFSPVPALLEKGINVGLGTDGYINNFFEVMRGAFLLHKAHLENPETMPPDAVYRMATENGARALGIPGIGRLDAGSPADIITIDADFPTPVNKNNLLGQLILYRNPEHVQEVYVHGKLLKEQGVLKGHDRKRLRQQVRSEAERLWSTG